MVSKEEAATETLGLRAGRFKASGAEQPIDNTPKRSARAIQPPGLPSRFRAGSKAPRYPSPRPRSRAPQAFARAPVFTRIPGALPGWDSLAPRPTTRSERCLNEMPFLAVAHSRHQTHRPQPVAPGPSQAAALRQLSARRSFLQHRPRFPNGPLADNQSAGTRQLLRVHHWPAIAQRPPAHPSSAASPPLLHSFSQTLRCHLNGERDIGVQPRTRGWIDEAGASRAYLRSPRRQTAARISKRLRQLRT